MTKLLIFITLISLAAQTVMAGPTAIELKRLELEAVDKEAQFAKDRPGEPNPYTEYVRSLRAQAEDAAQDAPVRPRRSWFARNWWWFVPGTAFVGFVFGASYTEARLEAEEASASTR